MNFEKFQWDDNKNELNINKHQIDFNDAKKVFEDENILISEDERKKYGETRWQVIGKMYNLIIFVAFTYRNEEVRIISARRANYREREKYQTNSF
ncbi:MAG: BrnT family toxin [Bacteroidales bacterium]|nr:BrnT family toxin [Bacteroidales bacterium]